jgi:hypothetical protein
LGTPTLNVQAPCVGSRLRSSPTKSRRSSAGSECAAVPMGPLVQEGAASEHCYAVRELDGLAAQWSDPE